MILGARCPALPSNGVAAGIPCWIGIFAPIPGSGIVDRTVRRDPPDVLEDLVARR
jgi:hypothetical protein